VGEALFSVRFTCVWFHPGNKQLITFSKSLSPVHVEAQSAYWAQHIQPMMYRRRKQWGIKSYQFKGKTHFKDGLIILGEKAGLGRNDTLLLPGANGAHDECTDSA
jgi:hypothetical protein